MRIQVILKTFAQFLRIQHNSSLRFEFALTSFCGSAILKRLRRPRPFVQTFVLHVAFKFSRVPLKVKRVSWC